MVRKACSLLPVASATDSAALGDPLAHDLTGAEGEHSARRDRHFDARLRIAADPFALVAQDEAAEAGDLDVLPLGQSVAHMVKDALDDSRRFGPRKPDLAMDDISEVGARQGAGISPPDGSRVGHLFSPPPEVMK